MRGQKGITLVALIITIIILLILAGISIGALNGYGIFDKAKDARDTYQNSAAEEETTLQYMNQQVDYYSNMYGN